MIGRDADQSLPRRSSQVVRDSNELRLRGEGSDFARFPPSRLRCFGETGCFVETAFALT